jgi:hypothetical protein
VWFVATLQVPVRTDPAVYADPVPSDATRHALWRAGVRMCGLFIDAIRPLVDDSSCDLIASFDTRMDAVMEDCETCTPFTALTPQELGCEPCAARAKVRP